MTDNEKDKVIEALTAVTANQHIEIVRCHDRINELLRFNNEFEERARKAEREAEVLQNKIDEWLSAAEDGRFN